MCGFAGFTYSDTHLLKCMWKTLQARAIDDEYFYTMKWYSFYHAHLKISDLDKNTSQPYISNTCVVWLVGEIYNKEEILNRIWIYHLAQNYTELEVISLAYDELWKDFINIVNGEFAISIFDIILNKHFLYRDRWGVNNLYYRIYNWNLYFASEIKTLVLDTPICSKKSMIDHLIFQFWIGPETIIQDIYSLTPWTYIEYKDTHIEKFNFLPYISQEEPENIIDSIEKSVIRRIPHFQKQIFLSLSGWPDSTLILFFLNKHFKWDIITYSFYTKENSMEIEIAKRNTKKLWIKHLLIDINWFELGDTIGDLIADHEGMMLLPNVNRIIKKLYPEYNNIKVEFWWDGKEELILGNNHYPYKEILNRFLYFYNKGLCPSYNIDQKFLNNKMFDYNLQMIDKITLRNWIERRLPFTDYEMLRFFKHKTYREEAKKYLLENDMLIVKGEFWYNLGIQCEYTFKPQNLVRNFISTLKIIWKEV
jgi:hypothetical protein